MARTAKLDRDDLAVFDAQTADTTLAFYESSAATYFETTANLNLGQLWNRFLSALPKGGRILDAGSGSGRDTRHFMGLGYAVDAFDASPALARLSSRFTGQTTRVASFATWKSPPERYDGIWAFASLLHVPRPELHQAVRNLARSLKPSGYLFASFKSDEHDLIDSRGRRFTNLTPLAAKSLFRSLPEFGSVEVWHEDARAAHGETTTWVYVMARRA
jgi:SAM-dependent methyltransferase